MQALHVCSTIPVLGLQILEHITTRDIRIEICLESLRFEQEGGTHPLWPRILKSNRRAPHYLTALQ